ncbi:hypothetical protein ACFXC0_28320 [Streptomyces althioticus]|uniref:hypothetical protein n=1 Tax=Streptomyces althioticus TaxID=83380 RepID=UPI0036841651
MHRPQRQPLRRLDRAHLVAGLGVRQPGRSPLYGCASFIAACPVIGWIDTSSSWFVCWGRGAWHNGGNNVWYYTMGDRVAPGQDVHHAWGFIPAVDVWTSTDPWADMTECNIP